MDSNTIHLSGEDEAVAEYLATKSAGDTVEFTVTGQVRELNDGGATIDIISAEPLDYEVEAPSEPPIDDQSALIGEIL